MIYSCQCLLTTRYGNTSYKSSRNSHINHWSNIALASTNICHTGDHSPSITKMRNQEMLLYTFYLSLCITLPGLGLSAHSCQEHTKHCILVAAVFRMTRDSVILDIEHRDLYFVFTHPLIISKDFKMFSVLQHQQLIKLMFNIEGFFF